MGARRRRFNDDVAARSSIGLMELPPGLGPDSQEDEWKKVLQDSLVEVQQRNVVALDRLAAVEKKIEALTEKIETLTTKMAEVHGRDDIVQ